MDVIRCHLPRLARVEKVNVFDIQEIKFLQIPNYWRGIALDFGFDLIKVLRSRLATDFRLWTGSISWCHGLPLLETL